MTIQALNQSLLKSVYTNNYLSARKSIEAGADVNKIFKSSDVLTWHLLAINYRTLTLLLKNGFTPPPNFVLRLTDVEGTLRTITLFRERISNASVLIAEERRARQRQINSTLDPMTLDLTRIIGLYDFTSSEDISEEENNMGVSLIEGDLYGGIMENLVTALGFKSYKPELLVRVIDPILDYLS